MGDHHGGRGGRSPSAGWCSPASALRSAEARRYFAPDEAFAAQLVAGAGAALLFALALVRTRRAPEPVEPEQDRYHIASYTQFNKPAPGAAGGALAEARARAESVLPADDGEA